MEHFKVTFYPDNKTVTVQKDTTILAASISAGIYINSSCGGDGVCGRCKVVLRSGKVLSQSSDRLTSDERSRGMYLACVTVVHGDLEIEVPPESRLSLEGLTPEEVATRLKRDYSEPEDIVPCDVVPVADTFAYAPLAAKLYLTLPVPDLEDKISDLERLERQIRKIQNIPLIHTGLATIRPLGELLRASDWKVTVTLGERNGAAEIVLIEPGDTAGKNFGFCFDIGTTTISGQLVELNTKKVLGTKATYNKQAAFGADVITRILYAKDQDGLAALHRVVVEDMNAMIQELTAEHRVDLNDVTCIVCAGNTTMIHLLLRIDPTYIRRQPYVPTVNFLPVVRAQEAELRINPRGLLACAPGVASYVGGDVVAGILDSGIFKSEGVNLLIDIGTNGEVVLGNRDFLISAAASAGPAFEGSGVACGMRASRGAMQKVTINPKDFEVRYEVIGKTKPLGICGSGYIDIIAGMLQAGLLDKDGKIRAQQEFILVDKKDSGTGSPIVITEPDIENLKRAKAAIYAAVSSLARHLCISLKDIEKIFIAGGFGSYLDMERAIRIGLLPDVERSKFLFIGNSSLAGARQILLSRSAMKLADQIAAKTTYFELSVDPHYMDEYMAALFFPHTDLDLFPSLKKAGGRV